MRWQNAKEKSLNRILGAENMLLDSQKRKEFRKDEKREDNITRDVKNLFRLKKNRTNQNYQKSF